MTAEPSARVWQQAVRLSAGEALIEGPLKGYHHETYAFPLPHPAGGAGTVRWKCREPREGILRFDRRSFPSEGALVRALAGHVSSVPEIIVVDDIGLQRFIEGSTLALHGRPGTAVPEAHVAQIERLFRELAAVPSAALPPEEPAHSAGGAADGDCGAFAEGLIRFTEECVHQAHRPVYGRLFQELGVPEEGLLRLAERTRSFSRRPFCLLHGDLHRENFIVDGDGRLWTIDWELAMFGDPLYDLATHLHLMGYPAEQEAAVARRWRDAVEEARPGSSRGWRKDLPHLLRYKRAQSVYTDVIRAALAVARGDIDWRALQATSHKLRTVLARGRSALGSAPPPDVPRIMTALVSFSVSAP
jgi:aminoglycoside phosphotransferase (APT) family kinase protein